MEMDGRTRPLALVLGAAGRRETVRALGAAGLAALTGIGLAGSAARPKGKARRRQGPGKRGRPASKGKHDRRPGASNAGARMPVDNESHSLPIGDPLQDGEALGADTPAGGVEVEKKKPGSRGATGPTGPTDPSPASVIRYGDADAKTAAHSASSFADCNAGEHATGGGFSVSVDATTPITALSSVPAGSLGEEPPTRWFASVATQTPGSKSSQAYAVCVPD